MKIEVSARQKTIDVFRGWQPLEGNKKQSKPKQKQNNSSWTKIKDLFYSHFIIIEGEIREIVKFGRP